MAEIVESNNFTDAYNEVVGFWPARITIILIRYENDLYEIRGLGEISDEISSIFIGRDDELIKRTINDAIYIIIHKLAKFCNSVNVDQIRIDAVHEIVSERIYKINVEDACGWTEDDISIAKDYIRKFLNSVQKR